RDRSADPLFLAAMARKVAYGPVEIRNGSEPFMTLALAGPEPDRGVAIAELDLGFVSDVVRRTKIRDKGETYVVDADGRLVAHPDPQPMSPIADFSRSSLFKAVRNAEHSLAGEHMVAGEGLHGGRSLVAFAWVKPMAW